MTWQYVPYIWPLLLSVVISSLLANLSLRRRSIPAAMPIFLFLVASTIWSLAYVFELSVIELPAKFVWIRFEYLGIVFVPITWLAFVLRYTGRSHWITQLRVALALVIPVLTLLLIWTNSSHHLVYADAWLDASLGPSLLVVRYGIGFWVYIGYSYLILLLATVLLLRAAWQYQRSGLYRGQVLAVSLGALLPWAGNTLHVLGISPLLDFTPFAFALTGLAIFAGAIRFRLFDVVPAAYQQVIQNMSDGIIVLDRDGRVVGLNPAAERITGWRHEQAIAADAARLLPQRPELFADPRNLEEVQAEVQLGSGPTLRDYELSVSPLFNRRGSLTGRLLTLHDMTWQKSVGRALRQERDKAQQYLDIVEVILLILNPDGEIVLVNRKGCRLLGYAAHELIGQNWFNLCLPAAYRQPVRQTLRSLLDGDTTLAEYYENPILTRSGVERMVAWHNAVLTGEDGRVTAVLSSGEDITERVHAEEELRRRTAALAALHETALDLAAQRALPDLLNATTGRAVSLLQAREGVVWQYRPESDDLIFAFSHSRVFNFPGAIIRRGESMAGRVLESGQPLVVDDYAAWAGRSLQFEYIGSMACVAVPISRGVQPFGVLVVLDDAPRRFSPADVELLQRFVPLAAAALEQARLLEEIQTRWQEAETLRQAAAALAGTLSLDEVLAVILDQLARVVRFDNASLFLLQDEFLRGVGARGFIRQEMVVGQRYHVSDDRLFQILQATRVPFFLDDAQADARFIQRVEEPVTRGWLGVPLIIRGTVIGCLTLDSLQPRVYGPAEARLAQAFADQAAVAIQNGQLYEASQLRLQEVRSLLDVSRDVTSTLELDQVLRRVIEAALASIDPAEIGALHLYDPDEDMLVVRSSVGLDPTAAAAARFRPGEGYAGWVFQHQEPLILGDVFSDPRTTPLEGYWSDRGISALCVPLIVRGRVIGTLSLDNFSQRNAFGPEHLDILTIFAGQAAVAIENAQLHAETERRLREQILLREAGAAMSAALDLKTVLSRIAEQLCQAINATSAYICDLVTDTNAITVVAEYLSPEASELEQVSDLGETYQEDDADFLQDMQAGRIVTMHRDDPNTPPVDRAHMLQYGAKTILYLPLQVRGRLVGYTEIWESRRRREYNSYEIALGRQVAQQAAITLENARLYDNTRRNAARLEALYQLSQDMTALLDVGALLKLVAAQSVALTGADRAMIVLIDSTAAKLVDVVTFGFGPNDQPCHSYQELMDGISGWVIRHRLPTTSDDIKNDPRNTGLALAAAIPESVPARSIAVAPLMIQDRVIGTLTLANNVGKSSFGQEDLDFLMTLAGQAAVSIENARLYQDAQQRASELGMLYEVAVAASQSARVQDVLEHTIRALNAALKPDNIAIFLVEAETGEIVARVWAGFGPDGPEAARRPIGVGVPGWVVEHGEPLLLPDVRQDPRYICADPDVLSELCVPLQVGQRVTGALNLERHELAAFDAEDLRILSILAGHLAAVVETARLVEGLEAEVAARTAEIAAEQEKSAVILSEVGDAIAMFDRARHIQYVNPAFVALTGYQEAEVLGQNLFDLLGGVVAEGERPALDAALAAGAAWQGEVTLRRKGGRLYDAHLTLAPIRDPAGRFTGYVSSHGDISRLKDLDRARSRFLTSISHELRTPVTSLKLYANLLRQGTRPEKAEAYLGVIEAQADRLGSLIQDVLEMTTLDGGQAVSVWQPLSWSSLVGDALTRFDSRARHAGIALSAGPLPPNLPPVSGDQARLSQALGELLENALIFTPTGGQVTLTVDARHADGRSWVAVAVRDTGPGIAPDEQERVFDRFFRGRLADSGHIPGTGLGLSMARTIMQAHGGRVALESAEGRGSTFALWLPAAEA